MNKKQIMVVVDLADGTSQITRLNVSVDQHGTSNLKFEINTPVYNDKRSCIAKFYKLNKRGVRFYREEE